MLHRFLIIVLFLSVLTITSCTNTGEKRTSYEIAYLVDGDTLKLINKDSLKYETNSIYLIVQGKSQKVHSNILDIFTSNTKANERSTYTMVLYRLFSNQNKVLAEFRMVDNDGNDSFDSFTATGDVKLISQKIGESWTTIRDIISKDINLLHNKGMRKVVDTSTGKEIKEED